MDYMWMLISFGLFMLSILTVFLSGLLNGFIIRIHPVVHIVIVTILTITYTNLFFDPSILWLVTIVVTICYFMPLFVVTLYKKGERVERSRSI